MSRRRLWQLGVADPLSLIILGFITVSFIIGATQVVKSGNSQFDTRSKAAGTKGDWESCRSGSECRSGNCGKDPGDNTFACLPGTPAKTVTQTTPPKSTTNNTTPVIYPTPAQSGSGSTGGTGTPGTSGSSGSYPTPVVIPPRPESPAEGQTDFEPHNECGPVGEYDGLFCGSGLRRIGVSYTYRNGSWSGSSADCRFDTACGSSPAKSPTDKPIAHDSVQCSSGQVCSSSCDNGTIVSQGCGPNGQNYCCRLSPLQSAVHTPAEPVVTQNRTDTPLVHDVATPNDRAQVHDTQIITVEPADFDDRIRPAASAQAASRLQDAARPAQPIIDDRTREEHAAPTVTVDQNNESPTNSRARDMLVTVLSRLPDTLTSGAKIHLVEQHSPIDQTVTTDQQGNISLCLTCDRSLPHDLNTPVDEAFLKKQLEQHIIPQLLLNQSSSSVKAGMEAFINSGIAEPSDTGLVTISEDSTSQAVILNSGEAAQTATAIQEVALHNLYANSCAQYYTDPVALKTGNPTVYQACRTTAAQN